MQSVVNIFKKDPPQVAGYSFDAILETRLRMGVDIPTYPIENGARISDHRVIKGFKYVIRGGIGNERLTSLKSAAIGLGAGLVSNLTDNPVVAAVSGMSAGFLASFGRTRPEAGLDKLIRILEGAEPFDVETGGFTLKNMLIKNITVEKNPTNENSLEFVMRLEEFISLDRLDKSGQPSHKNMKEGSQEQSSCAKNTEKGSVNTKTASSGSQTEAKAVLV